MAHRLEVGRLAQQLLLSAQEQQWEARHLAAVMAARRLEDLLREQVALGPSLLSNLWEASVQGLVVEVLEGVVAADLARGAEVP